MGRQKIIYTEGKSTVYPYFFAVSQTICYLRYTYWDKKSKINDIINQS